MMSENETKYPIRSETYCPVKKVSDFFFCENLVDFNEAHLHEATFIRMREFFPPVNSVS